VTATSKAPKATAEGAWDPVGDELFVRSQIFETADSAERQGLEGTLDNDVIALEREIKQVLSLRPEGSDAFIPDRPDVRALVIRRVREAREVAAQTE